MYTYKDYFVSGVYTVNGFFLCKYQDVSRKNTIFLQNIYKKVFFTLTFFREQKPDQLEIL